MRRGDGRDRANALRPASPSYTDGIQASPLQPNAFKEAMADSAPIRPRLSEPTSDKMQMWDRFGFNGNSPNGGIPEAQRRALERQMVSISQMRQGAPAAPGQVQNKMLQLGAGAPPPNAPGLQATGPVPDMSAMANILQRKAPPPGLGRYGMGGTDAISNDILSRRKNTMGY